MSEPKTSADPEKQFTPQQIRPLDLKILREQSELRIQWADGVESVYPLVYLRKECPCAGCRAERNKKPELLPVLSKPPLSTVGVASARLAGNYAIKILWADGHGTGIYEYSYLRAIDPAR